MGGEGRFLTAGGVGVDGAGCEEVRSHHRRSEEATSLQARNRRSSVSVLGRGTRGVGKRWGHRML
jgi:hypothetical protein